MSTKRASEIVSKIIVIIIIIIILKKKNVENIQSNYYFLKKLKKKQIIIFFTVCSILYSKDYGSGVLPLQIKNNSSPVLLVGKKEVEDLQQYQL